VEHELLTLPEHMSSSPVFSWFRVTRSLVLCVYFVDRCLSFRTFFFWSLCCLFFFDIRIMITLLVSANTSYLLWHTTRQCHVKESTKASLCYFNIFFYFSRGLTQYTTFHLYTYIQYLHDNTMQNT